MRKDLVIFIAHVDDCECASYGYLFKHHEEYEEIKIVTATTWPNKVPVWEKNLKNLLQAIKNSNLRMLIIGNGPLKNELMNSFEKNVNQIKWIENVSNYEIPKYMNKSKILVLPSLYEGIIKLLNILTKISHLI